MLRPAAQPRPEPGQRDGEKLVSAEHPAAFGQQAGQRFARDDFEVGQIGQLGQAGVARPAANHHALASDLPRGQRLAGERGVIERAQAGGRHYEHGRAQRHGQIGDRGPFGVIPDQEAARSFYEHQVPGFGELNHVVCGGVHVQRRQACGASGGLGGQRAGEPGELVGVGDASEPPHGLHIGRFPALCARFHPGLAGFTTATRSPRASATAASAAVTTVLPTPVPVPVTTTIPCGASSAAGLVIGPMSAAAG